MRILLAQINPTIGDLHGNTEKILNGIARAKKNSADIVVFPELAICGYPPEDFLLLPHFLDAIEKKLEEIIAASSGITVIVGTPRINPTKTEKHLYNSAAVIQNQHLLGYQDKTLLPTYDVFSERRYFEPSQCLNIWELNGKKVGLTICEDIWQQGDSLKYTTYRRNPIQELKALKPDLFLNISASPYTTAQFKERLKVCSSAAKTLDCPVFYCNQVGANDSLIFDGYSLSFDRHGNAIACAKGFEEDFLLVDTEKSLPPIKLEEHGMSDLHQALVLGVRDYFSKSNFKQACLGLSGGIDSALVACIAVDALGKENVIALGMPSRFTSKASFNDAHALVKNLGITYEEVSIESPFKSYLELLAPYFEGRPREVTEENLQARIRGMLLMAFSNKFGYIVLSTGNKSELAMGYTTLYGDMCGGLSVINDVSKMQVYALSRWINREKEIIPQNTIDKAPSAELRSNQKDSDSLPEYQVIDHVLQAYLEEHLSPQEIASRYGYSEALVQGLIQRIHKNEYKRRQSAPGLRVSEKAFTVGRRFPIVQKWV